MVNKLHRIVDQVHRVHFEKKDTDIQCDLTEYAALSLSIEAGAHVSVLIGASSCTVHVGPGAQCEIIQIHRGAEIEGTYEAIVKEDARLLWAAVWGNTVGVASYTFHLRGNGAQVVARGMTVGSGDGRLKIKTTQYHERSQTVSDLLFKSVLYDSSRSEYGGTVVVEPHLFACHARQYHVTTLMGLACRVISQPTLEIESHQVTCKHGSAAGPLDVHQVDYLKTRGLSEDRAKALLLDGFFASIPAELSSWSQTRWSEYVARIAR